MEVALLFQYVCFRLPLPHKELPKFSYKVVSNEVRRELYNSHLPEPNASHSPEGEMAEVESADVEIESV